MRVSRPLLALDRVEKHFTTYRWRDQTVVRAVDGVSFDIREGEVIGLAGESGCGKSTIANVIAGLQAPTAGRVMWKGRDLRDLAGRAWREYRLGVQMVFQDPDASLNPHKTVSSIIGMPLRALGITDPSQRQARIFDVLSRVHLTPPTEYARKYPYELSGGEKQRVGIARAIVGRPQLLIADEPVASLDTSIRGQIVRLLGEINEESGIPILIISHDLNVLSILCSRLLILYLGRIVEQGSTDDVLSRPEHHYTAGLRSLVSIPDPRRSRELVRESLRGEPPSPSKPPSGCRFHPRCPHQIMECSSQSPVLGGASPSHLFACHNPVSFTRTYVGEIEHPPVDGIPGYEVPQPGGSIAVEIDKETG